jgi:AcrR family transcriptional regulator
MRSVSRQAWLDEGIKILDEQGANALTIDALATRLEVTKGSFYHHFKNYQGYKEALLDYFEQQSTLTVIDLVEEMKTPSQKLAKLLDLTMVGPPRIEVAIRAWALLDGFVQNYQQRIDERRINYLKKLWAELRPAEAPAEIMAQMLYAVYVGSQHIVPPINNENLKQIYAEIKRIYHLH